MQLIQFKANEIEKISEFVQKSIYLTVKNREKE